MSERRDDGNPNRFPHEREAGRLGRARTPADIPRQKEITSIGFPSAAIYKIGQPQRPPIRHDNGFLERFRRREPTFSDYTRLAKWKAMLEGAEALRPDLTDGLAAYRHFLEGEGEPRQFSYERYVMNDNSGQITLKNAIFDIQKGVMEIWKNQSPKTTSLYSFELTGSAIACGRNNPSFPYPVTENWQKAIGAHFIWLSGRVKVITPRNNGTPSFQMVLTLHAEDRYNFNPGAADIATGIPDEDNGVFEITGLAHQYDHFSTLVREVKWSGIKYLGGVSSPIHHERHRQPSDNRRIRNRV